LLIARPTSKAQTARTKMMAAVAALCLVYIESRFLLRAARAQLRVPIPFGALTAHSPLYNPAPSLSTPQPVAPARHTRRRGFTLTAVALPCDGGPERDVLISSSSASIVWAP
jgi:hypothetical protein